MKVHAIAFVALFFMLLLIMPVQVLAQFTQPLELQWSETYDNFFASSVVPAQDTGFMIVGSNPIPYPPVLSLMKTNSNSSVDWTKTYPEAEGLSWVIQQVESSYILSSHYLDWLKIDVHGNIEWSKKFDLNGRQRIAGLTVAEDGSYVLVKSSYSVGQTHFSVCKYGVDDVLCWEQQFYDYSVSFLQSDSGDGYYIAGSQDGKFWFAKLDLDGEVVWSRVYSYRSSGSTSLVFHSFIPTLDGGFLLSGSNDENCWLVKTGSDGKEQWHRQYDNHRMGYIIQDKSGQYLMFNGHWIIVLDGRGKELWAVSCSKYVADFEDSANAMVQFVSGAIDDGNFVVAITYNDVQMDSFVTWVAGFTFKSVSSLGCNMWLFGVVAVVIVFVGFLVYLTKCRARRVLVG